MSVRSSIFPVRHGPDPQLSKQFEEYSNPVDTEFMKKGSAVYVWSAHNKCVTRYLHFFTQQCDIGASCELYFTCEINELEGRN